MMSEKLNVGSILQEQQKDTNVKLGLEECQEFLEEENKNESTKIILQNTQEYNTDHITDVTTNTELKEENCRDTSFSKIQNNEKVNAKCDENTKGYVKDESTRKMNFMHSRKNISRNDKKVLKENNNESTEKRDDTIRNCWHNSPVICRGN